jgi:CBS domain-containing protein
MRLQEILDRKGHDVITITPDRSVLQAVELLVEHNIGGVVVVEDGSLVGILTERDVLRLTARTPGALDGLTVAETMTRELVTGLADDDMLDVMGLMTRRRIRHLPILDEGRLAGIVSIGDLVNACRRTAEEENQHMREYIQGRA